MRNGVGKNVKIDKAVEVLLYIISKGCNNMYNILKVIYFSDKNRIVNVASTMYKETYFAMNYGPVPSVAYDILRDARGTNNPPVFGLQENPFVFDEEGSSMIYATREPNLNYLSEGDIQCLDKCIKMYGQMDYNTLKDISHRQSDYQWAREHSDGQKTVNIPLDIIVASVDPDGKIKEFLDSV